MSAHRKSALDNALELRSIWLRHRAAAAARIEAGYRDVAKADAALDRIDNQIAELRLKAAADLLESGATA